MNAIHGMLRVDQTYSIVSNDYLGDYFACDNCGLMIKNSVNVKGSIDTLVYTIGLDCASTLTSINPCELLQAKKELSKKARFVKALKQATSIIINEKYNSFWFYYGIIRNEWSVNFRGRGSYSVYKNIIDAMNIPKTLINN